jgi:uncharacterized membrane protein
MKKIFADHPRIWISLLTALVVAYVTPAGRFGLERLLVSWNAGVLLFLVLMFVWLRGLDSEQLRSRYQEKDPTVFVILVLTTFAALLSLVAILALLATSKHGSGGLRAAHFALAVLTVASSWLLVPTVFTLHYANMYFSGDPEHPPLLFPGGTSPGLWDFVYFSFTIAVACQTADVSTSQAAMRKVVIAQSLVAFIFNVSILGFAINVSSGLLSPS